MLLRIFIASPGDCTLERDAVRRICNEDIVSLVSGCFAIFLAIGFRQQKYEDLTKVKKIALQKFLFCFRIQISAIQYITLGQEDCKELFNCIVKPGYNLYKEATIVINTYDNLINRWELEAVKQMGLKPLQIKVFK